MKTGRELSSGTPNLTARRMLAHHLKLLDNATLQIFAIIELSPTSDSSQLLTAFLAALVHPDMFCPLASLRDLPAEYRRLAAECFEARLTALPNAELDHAVYTRLLPFLSPPPVSR